MKKLKSKMYKNLNTHHYLSLTGTIHTMNRKKAMVSVSNDNKSAHLHINLNSRSYHFDWHMFHKFDYFRPS